jgi:hypothetical protein
VKKYLAGLNSPSDQINTVDDKTVELDAIDHWLTSSRSVIRQHQEYHITQQTSQL